MAANWKDNISFVLVEPREWGNVGASARAMKNMGFKNLVLVRPPELPCREAEWFAHNSLEVLDKAEVHFSLADALRDKALVVGVARRVGKRRGVIMSVNKGVQRLREFLPDNKIALLFGRENKGLYNEEIDECGFVITIPSNREHPSLNLSHAVMVVAYELSMAQMRLPDVVSEIKSVQKRQRDKVVSHGELTSLYERVAKVLLLLDYIPRGDRDIERQIMSNLKHFFGRSGLTGWELKMLHGLCSQVERFVPGASPESK